MAATDISSPPPEDDDARPSAWSSSMLPGEGPDQLELAMKRRLLHSLSERGSTEAAALVIPGVLCWMYGFAPGHRGMWAWWAGFVAAACLLNAQRRRMQRATRKPDADAVQRWERHYARTALIVGLFWAAPLGFGLYGSTVEFRLVVYICLCAILASTATFVAPLPQIFWRFYAVVFVPMAVAVPWSFPLRWKYLLPLTLLYGAVIARHAWGGRRLIEQQVEQERQRLRLAERYRLAKEEAERALQERNRFISTTSHDLRQPLHAMGLLVQAAVQRNADAQLAPVLRDVQDCVRSLSFMFNALLDLSRLESGAFTARQEDLPLAAVFEDAARLFGPDAEHRGLGLRVVLPRARDPWVCADPTLLRQMVFNLLQNALRYTPAGGVLLAARPRGGRWRIEVWDTGSGIAEQDRERIYAPYARGEAGLLAAAQGHGLGLAVVARCAQLTGAEYGFASRPQRGSCFWLELPAASPWRASRAGRAAAAGGAPRRLAGRHLPAGGRRSAGRVRAHPAAAVLGRGGAGGRGRGAGPRLARPGLDAGCHRVRLPPRPRRNRAGRAAGAAAALRPLARRPAHRRAGGARRGPGGRRRLPGAAQAAGTRTAVRAAGALARPARCAAGGWSAVAGGGPQSVRSGRKRLPAPPAARRAAGRWLPPGCARPACPAGR